MTEFHPGKVNVLPTFAQFTGTESYHRTMRPDVVHTDGVKALAEHCKAFWLIDAIVSHQTDPKVRAEPFQEWTLERVPDSDKATLTCGDGNGNVVARQVIEYTDFPYATAEIWLTGGVMLIPSEY